MAILPATKTAQSKAAEPLRVSHGAVGGIVGKLAGPTFRVSGVQRITVLNFMIECRLLLLLLFVCLFCLCCLP